MAAWIPKSFDEACKRNAGRRKLHMRKRKARADRIVRVLGAMDSSGATELRDSTYGLLAAASLAMEVSKATVSRDFALVRRIHRQFERMFGRSFDSKKDQIVWSWNFDHYAFKAPESKRQGIRNPSATSHSILANRKPRSPTVGSPSCPGTTPNSSHS